MDGACPAVESRVFGPGAGPVLVILSELQAVGKSHFARRLSAVAGAERVEFDSIRRELFSVRTYSDAEHRAVFAAAMERADAALRAGRHTVVDATLITKHARDQFCALAQAAGCRWTIVQFDADAETLRERFARRAQRTDSADLSEAGWDIHQMMRPALEVEIRPHWAVRSAADADSVLDALAAVLSAPTA